MLGAVYSEQAQCQDCYRCVRECPVKAIRVTEGHATVLPERCIACGSCIAACPAGAKRVRDDLEAVETLLQGKPIWHRFTATEASPRLCTMQNEFSWDGQNWTAFGEGRMTRK